MSVASYVLAALGLAVLMVVHESGHFFAARYFGMRVLRFSIGFGPTIVKHQPKGSTVTYQIAVIPFLAYVQIDGMNPYEEIDPKDKASFANASLWARVVTIAAGPLSNYFFATVLMFFGFLLAGRLDIDDVSMRVDVNPTGPAETAGIRDGDKLTSVNGTAIHNWDELKSTISSHAYEDLDIVAERDGVASHYKVSPVPKGQKYEGKIEVGAYSHVVPVTAKEALVLSLVEPAKVVYNTVNGLVRWASGKEKAELSGPVGIVKETAGAVRSGAGDTFKFLGALSAYLGGFNLLPFPALDGGRLLFLAIEGASRRKPDAKVEARVHAVGLLMMLTLIAIVTWTEVMPKH